MSNRLWLLLAAGAVATSVVTTIALAGSTGTTAPAAVAPMTLSLNGAPPFPVKSYSLEIEADSSWSKGSGASVGRPSAGPFTFTKFTDKAIDDVITNIVRGTSFAKGELTVPLGNGEKLVYQMSGMFVTSVVQTGEGGRPTDKVEVVYKTLEWKLGSASGGWDISQGKVT